MSTREKALAAVSRTGIIANLLLVCGKAVVGVLSHSVAITVDAVNNLTDALSAIITLAGARAAAKVPDKEHPFGHGRLEYVSSMAIAALILFTAVSAMYESVQKIFVPPDTVYDTASVLVMAASIAVKLVLSRYCRAQAAALDSQALRAAGTDAAFDAVISCSILAGAAVRTFWGINIDGWLGAAISVVIFHAGLDILKEGLSSIIGERVPATLSQTLREEILAFDAVDGVWDLLLHRYGPGKIVGSVCIELPEDMTVGEADGICRRISEAILERHGIALTVGVYASNYRLSGADEIHTALHELAAQGTGVLQVHGFRADLPERHVSFHLMLDYSCPDKHAISERIIRELETRFPDIRFSAVVDLGAED